MSLFFVQSISILYQILLLMSTLMLYLDCVSFFGSNYISLPLQDSTNKTRISFRFKASKSDALLLLISGSDDYCLVALENGNILVRIDLGLEESVLKSPKNLKLNDLRWHSVNIERIEGEMSLTIDGLYSTFVDILGPFFELNIEHGIYIGGFDDLSSNSKFLGNLKYFRGCIENLYFNNIDVFHLALNLNLDMEDFIFECSSDFDAGFGDAISFIENEAFIKLPRDPTFRKGGTLSFEVKTSSEFALLFYTTSERMTSSPVGQDFIAIEIINGRVTFTANEGNGAIALQSNVTINDGQWHFVEAIFKPDYREIKVDDKSRNVRPSPGPNQFYDLSSDFFFGGVELSKQLNAIEQDLQSIEAQGQLKGSSASFKGCLKNLKVNSVSTGLPHVLVSKGIKAKCLWEFPCLTKSPCIDGSKCHQDGLDDYRCFCNQNVCVKPNFTDTYKIYNYKSDSALDLQLLTLRALSLLEGGSQLITTEHINVSFDYHRLGIEETEIIFVIKQYPKHGILEIEIIGRSLTGQDIPDNAFTYSDLIQEKISYTHSGTESLNDTIFFQMRFVPRTYRLPRGFENQKQDFIFFINIAPVNDPPRFQHRKSVLNVIRNTKKLITNKTLKAVDDDNLDSELEYRLISIYNCARCFLEYRSQPGIPLTTFTQEDINKRHVYFFYQSYEYIHDSIQIVLSLSDGIVEKPLETIIEVKLENLKLTLANNSGLKLPYNRSLAISSENLSFSTNADPEQELEIKYEIIMEPSFGVIQKMKANGQWIDVKVFTQKQINKGKIRYLHIIGEPAIEKVSLRVSCLSAHFENLILFEITFITSRLKLVNNKLVIIDHTVSAESVIKEDDLKYEVSPYNVASNKIIYTVHSLPTHGHLHLSSNTQSFKIRLKVGSTFTQENIDDQLLIYSSRPNIHHSVQDHFFFQVTQNDNWSMVKTDSLRFEHIPKHVDVLVTNEKLVVFEGEKAIITAQVLNVKFKSNKGKTFFNVTRQPAHGKLVLANLETPTQVESFSSYHINKGYLSYLHDDSENESDSFDFIARPVSDDNYYHATFSFQIEMKNDNPPRKVVDKMFYVVINHQRHLTQNIIEFIDLDLNTGPEDIQYSIKSISNGYFFFVSNYEAKASHFTQKDINLNKIMFKHHGHKLGEAVFTVSDGYFTSAHKLKIEASEPFIKIFKFDLIAKASESALLTTDHLRIETNYDIENENEVIFVISSLPLHGVITNRGKESNQFTLNDLKMERVEFESRPENLEAFYEDGFAFELKFKNIVNVSTLPIKIYPESYWNSLILLHNKPGAVSQGKSLTITSDHLKVFHSSLNSWNITFTAKTMPKFGVFQKCDQPLNELDMINKHQDCKIVTSFTQFDINQRQIAYLQNVNNASVTDESVLLEVSSKLSKLPPIEFKINIITTIILLKVENLTVLEGKQCTILPKHLKVINAYYQSVIREYLLLEEPKYGKIRNIQSPEKPIFSFTSNELESELIVYEQDGSESIQDWFTIVARTINLGNETKESLPSTIHVYIKPVNDETPYLVNSTDFILPQESSMLVTRTHLLAADQDSGPAEIIYEIIESTNGYFSDHNSSTNRLTAFTQDQIDKKQVDFVHHGDLKGFVKFQLTDGSNYDELHYIAVTADKVVIKNKVNQKLHVFPGTQQTISKQHLYSFTTDGKESPIVYQIVQPPSLGKVLKEMTDGSVEFIKSFSQKDINQGLILYEQSEHIDKIFVQDEIIINIQSESLEPLIGIKFKIEVSIINLTNKLVHQMDSLIQTHPLIVAEGREAIINDSNIKLSSLIEFLKWKNLSIIIDSIYLTIDQKPSHAAIIIQQSNVTSKRVNEIPIQALANNSLIYKHDDSNTFNDTIEFGIYLYSSNQKVKITDKKLRVTIIPINDEKPILLTPNPFIEIVKGGSALINTTVLNTMDNDMLPVVYHLIEEPICGYFAFNDSKVSLKRFTQSNIDSQWIYFQHCARASSERFKMKVTDGHFDPIVFDFNVNVIPLKLIQVHLNNIFILQSDDMVKISDQVINFKSNNQQSDEDIFYRVIEGPFLGSLLISNLQDNRFYQNDVNQNLVFYKQNNMTASGDYFIVNGFKNNELLTENITINITVKPLINAQNDVYISINPNQKMILTINHLDASPLAEKTKSNPIYRMTKKSKYGSLKKEQSTTKLRTLRNVQEEVNQFTHEDILNKKIFYNIQSDLDFSSYISNDLIQDTIEFELIADSVQPAPVSLKLNLIPISSYPSSTLSPSATLSLSTIDYFRLFFPSHQWLIYVFIICIIICIFLIIFKVFSPKAKAKPSQANNIVNNHVDDNFFKPYNRSNNPTLDSSALSPINDLLNDQLLTNLRITSSLRANSLTNVCSPVTTFKSGPQNYRATISRFDNISERLNTNLFPLPPPSLYFESANEATNPKAEYETSIHELDAYSSGIVSEIELLSRNRVDLINEAELSVSPLHKHFSCDQQINSESKFGFR